MLDPIADKAMVVIALAVIVGLWGMKALILVPVAFILLREIFVSGLREFLGAKAGQLKVTYLAKWKTTAQMVAIPVLLLAGVFEWDRRHNAPWVSDWFHDWMAWLLSNGGLILIWVAGLLTLLTGYDYLMKALPFLRTASDDADAALLRLAARAGGRAVGDGRDRGRRPWRSWSTSCAGARSATRWPSPTCARCGSRSTRSWRTSRRRSPACARWRSSRR